MKIGVIGAGTMGQGHRKGIRSGRRQYRCTV